MRITATAEGDTLLVEVGGVVDFESAPEFRDRMLELVRTGSGTIIVNLEGVDRLDCAGVLAVEEGDCVSRLEGGVRPGDRLPRSGLSARAVIIAGGGQEVL